MNIKCLLDFLLAIILWIDVSKTKRLLVIFEEDTNE